MGKQMVEDNINKKSYEVTAQKKQVNVKDLDTQSELVKSDKEFPYDVKICDVWGTSSKDIMTIPVKRYIEGANVFLFNEKFNFKEYFPIDSDDFKQYTLESVETELIKIEKKIASPKNNENPRTLREELRILRNRKRSLETQGRGSYMRLNQQGRPYFEFDRVGNFKLPVFKNVDYSTLNVPSETRIKTTSELLVENDTKNGDKNLAGKVMGIILLVILVCAVFGGLFFAYKTAQLPDQCAANLDKASLVFNGVVTKMDNVVDNFEEISENLQIKPKEINDTPRVNVIK